MGFKDKTPEMQEFLNNQAQAWYGMTIDEAHKKRICIICKTPVRGLKGVDFSEYEISAICPNCFPKEEEDDQDTEAGKEDTAQ